MAGYSLAGFIRDELKSLGKNFQLSTPIESMDMRDVIKLRCENEWTPLHYAMAEGRHAFARLLLEYGADINAVNNTGSTPLHIAANDGKPACIDLLLECNPMMNIKDNDHDTPLNILIKWPVNFHDKLNKFLESGADPNIPDHLGYTPLHNAIACHRHEVACEYARSLLRYKATPNVRSNNGKTPLHAAIERGYGEVVQLLLDDRASVYEKDNAGENQLDLAIRLHSRYPSVLEVIGKHVIKQYCRGMKVKERHLSGICKNPAARHFKNICDQELMLLKSNTLGRSTITYYDVLVSPPDKMRKYLRNPDVISALHDLELDNYVLKELIQERIFEGVKRNRAAPIGYIFFNQILPTHIPELPEICADKIISFLTNEELHNLQRAFPRLLRLR